MCFPIIKRLSNLLFAAVVLTALGTFARAQTETGRIDGVVTDVMGAAVPRAKIVITSGLISRTLETDEMGQFQVAIVPGIARITVERPGFKIAKLNRVRVAAGASRSLKIVLRVQGLKYGKCPKGQSPCIWL
jgi:hypothetical protein